MVNKVILLGNTGKNPEIINGEAVKIAKLTLATSEKFKNKSGETVTETTWHNLVIFGKLAEIAEKFVKKGDQLYCEGSIKNGSYEKDGAKHYTHDIKVDSFKMLGSKSESKETKTELKTLETDMYDKDVKNDDDLPF